MRFVKIFLLIFLLLLFANIYPCIASQPSVVSLDTYGCSLALLSDGSVWTWGEGNPTPRQVVGLSGVVQAAAKGNGCVALKDDGTVWLGFNNGSQPVRVPYLDDVRLLRAFHVLKNDGTIWIWSESGFTGEYLEEPVKVPGLTNITYIDDFGALRDDGTVWEWGITRGKSGVYSSFDNITPVQVQITDVKAISEVVGSALALKNDGTVWEWGKDLDHNIINIPKRAEGIDSVKSISAGMSFNMALKNDGTLWSWGENDNGGLGISSIADKSLVPVKVPIDDVELVKASGAYVLALKRDGSVWAWGRNTAGELGCGIVTVPKGPGVRNPDRSGIGTPTKVLLNTGGPITSSVTPTPTIQPVITPGISPFPSPLPGTTGENATVSPTDTMSPAATATPAPSQSSGFGTGITLLSCLISVSCTVLYILWKKRE